MTRPMVTVGLPFLTIALAASFFRQEFLIPVVIGLLVILAGSVILLRGNRRVTVAVVSAASLLACLNWMAYQNRTSYDFSTLEGTRFFVSGTIENMVPTSSGTRMACTVWVDAHNLADAPKEFRAILYTPTELDGDYYDRISAEAKYLPFTSGASFDGKRYYESQGISVILSAYGTPEIRSNPSPPLIYYFKTLNRKLCRWVEDILPSPESGLAKAVFLGDDSDLDGVLYNWFQRAGITHIFVVSGLHVSLMAGGVLLFLRKLGMSQRMRVLLTGCAVWCFVALTGFRISAVRAGIMMTILLASELFHRPSDGLNSLCLAGVVILLVHPAAILSLSFLLTFTAALGAIVLARPISEWLETIFHCRGKVGHSICSVLGTTIGCNLAMLPVTIDSFQGISLTSLLANLIVIPLLPPILTVTGLLLLLHSIPLLAIACGKLLELFFGIVVRTAEFCAAPDWGYLGLNYSFVPVWLWGSLAIILLAYFSKKNRRFIGRLSLLSLLLFAGMLGLERWSQANTVEVAAVSSFEAEGVAFLKGDSAVVLDLSDDGYLDRNMERFLRSRNIRRVETLVLGYPQTRIVSDMEYLTDCMLVGNLILFEEDPYAPYAGRILSLYGSVYPLAAEHGFELASIEMGEADLYRMSDGVLFTLTVKNTKIAVTNSRIAAEKVNCEILLTTQKILDFPAKKSAKYVILLNMPRESELSILLNQDGSYRFRG